MKVIISKTHEESSVKVAQSFTEQIKSKPDSVICFATGSTPLIVYKELVKEYENNGLDFSKIITFNLDEYYRIDPRNEQSYRSFMTTNLFHKVGIEENQINFLDGHADNAELECERYENKLSKNPINLLILGIGENGHIAFNEPGTPFEETTHQVQLTESTIKANARFFESEDEVPKSAITMGIQSIMNADKIVLLATGDKKAEAIRQMIEEEPNEECPASVLRMHPDVTIFVDEMAASKLKGN